jgi:superfamily II DNA or RNA helicase
MRRKQIQEEAVKKLLQNKMRGLLNVAPRVGKTRIVLEALKGQLYKHILVTVPFNIIKESWLKEIKQWELPKEINLKVVNQRSLEKEDLNKYDLIVIDEIHSLSERQMEYLLPYSPLLGLSGSLSERTQILLKDELDLDVIYYYSIEEAVKDGIISNFNINVVYCELSDHERVSVKTKTKTYEQTERARYNSLTRYYEDMAFQAKTNRSKGMAKMAAAGKRANFLYSAPTKIALTKFISDKFDRALIFTARIAVADQLAASYHSKSKINTYEQFVNEDINKLAVAQMVQMGVTIPNLKVGIFQQMKSNDESAVQKVLRMCNLEDDKVAEIYICCYKNTVDENWVNNALELLPKDKIKFLTKDAI